jgi:FKBP-type peptidyl-prolyl cis-trans isomerase
MRHLLLALCLAGCTATSNTSPYASTSGATTGGAAPTAAAPKVGVTPQPGIEVKKSESGLRYQVLAEGKGEAIANGQSAKVHYTGKLMDGTVFDSSLNRGEPIEFVLGEGRVIPGWEQGILGMKQGEKRFLFIPPALGYGEAGFPPVIPPSAELAFEVELVGMGPLPEGTKPKPDKVKADKGKPEASKAKSSPTPKAK